MDDRSTAGAGPYGPDELIESDRGEAKAVVPLLLAELERPAASA